MRDNWLEIVAQLQPYFDVCSNETEYQKEVENCMKILGWKSINKSMQSEYSMPIGNNNTIRIDIFLSKDDYNILPIEVKRPTNVCSSRQESQLMSYMRMLRACVGLYIGEEIRLYYDNPEDSLDAICVFSSKIDFESEKGVELCKLLTYSNFERNRLESFCKEKYSELQSRKHLLTCMEEFLSPEKAEENVLALIKNQFIEQGYEDVAIDEALKDISIIIKRSVIPEESVVVRDSSFPSYSREDKSVKSTSECIRKHSVRESYRSNLVVTFADGTIISDKKGIEVEKQFILKVGVERVRQLRIMQCGEDLIGSPQTTRNPETYKNRWTPLGNGLYIFNCSSNPAKKLHIEKIIASLNIKASVKLEL